MYEQLSLFDSEIENKQRRTLFEQILPVIKDPIIPCVNCLCQYCTHNVEEVYRTVTREEAAECEQCFMCDECCVYDGHHEHELRFKQDCEMFILSEYGAKRNRKRFILMHGKGECRTWK